MKYDRTVNKRKNLFIKHRELLHVGNEDDENNIFDFSKMKPTVLVNLGTNTYKKVPYDFYSKTSNIKSVKFKYTLIQWNPDDGIDDEPSWTEYGSHIVECDPIKFILFCEQINSRQDGFNQCTESCYDMLFHYDFSKIRITFSNGSTKKMKFRKFLEKYYDDVVFNGRWF